MSDQDLFSRLKQARIVQVLIVYLGASWVILQFVDVLMGMLSLPEWIGPAALLLLLIGLVIVLATAWIQSLPSTTAAEKAGEVPTDWEIAPGDVLSSLRQGRLPHLTWGRAIFGGVIALSLLFGASGLFVLVTGRAPVLGPEPAGASVAATGLAVLPFDVTGADAELLREGIPDLLSKGLDGVGDLRAIDSRTVLARWDRMVDEDATADLDAALRVAGATGARYAVWGSAVAVGDQMRLTGDIYDLDSREKVGQASAEGAAGDLLQLVDFFAVEVRRGLLEGASEADLAVGRVENITTHSLPALRAYLEGAASYRRADFPKAAEAFERAIAEDSTFALAYYRLNAAYGSMEISGTPESDKVARLLDLLQGDLPPRARRLLEGGRLWAEGSPEALRFLRQTVELFPDDPEAWFNLGEYYFHDGALELASHSETRQIWMRTLDLDPGFAPSYIHLIQVQMALGDSAAARSHLNRYLELAPEDSHQAEALSLAYDLQFGTPPEMERARARVAEVSSHVAGDTWLGVMGGPATDPAREWIARSHGWTTSAVLALVSQGRVDEALSVLMSDEDLHQNEQAALLYLLQSTGIPPSEEGAAVLSESADPASCTSTWDATCHVVVGAMAVDRRDWAGVDAVIGDMEQRAQGFRDDPEMPGFLAEAWDASATAVEGYRQLAQGLSEDAVRSLERVQGRARRASGQRDLLVRMWLARAYEAQGHTNEAVRYLESLLWEEIRWFADFSLVDAYASAERPEDARRAGETFLAAWSRADEALTQPDQVRAALDRLNP
jgi:tetratricopeptide (TPR) repeat protein